jgi:hypothetical protein
MTKNEAVIIASIVAILAVTYGVTFAQADTDFKDITPQCLRYNSTDYLETQNVTKKQLICEWEIIEITEFKPKVGATQNNTDAEIEIIEEATECRNDPNCDKPQEAPYVAPAISEDIVDILEHRQKRINNYCADWRDDPMEQLACETYKAVKLCEQGIDESFPVQEHRYFLTTDFEMSIWYHFQYRTGIDYVVGELQKARLECDYQRNILEPIILGPRYQDIADANVIDGAPHHSEMVSTDYRVQHQRLTPAVFNIATNNAFDALCAIPGINGADYGCPLPELDGEDAFDVQRDVKNPKGYLTMEERFGNNLPYQKSQAYAQNEVGFTRDTIVLDASGLWTIGNVTTPAPIED